MLIKIKKIKNGKIPEYKTDGSAGADCYARIQDRLILKPKERITIPLGFAVELPIGYEMEIRGRSGLASKNGIEVFQGTIDSDYRGEVGAIIRNTDDKDFIIKPFDRIAQAVISPVIRAEWHLTENLSETERGEGGFGSTDVAAENKKTIGIEVEANLNITKKFYEPFTNHDSKLIYEYLGKEVTIDNIYSGIFSAVRTENLIVKVEFQITSRADGVFGNYTVMNLPQAFQRVMVNGHRFGKEMEFEG